VRGQTPVDSANKAGADSASKADDDTKKTADSTAKADQKGKAAPEPEFVYKTDAEWRKILTKTQYAVTRLKYTEPPFSGKYATAHYRTGTFVCICCGNELFQAQHKFDSGTGWPSFYRAASEKALQSAIDNSELEPRMEVMCRRCGAHLGHVFNDGPPPTGLRFCINSISINYKRPGAQPSDKSAASKSASSSKTKPKAKAKTASSRKPAARSNGSDSTARRSASDQPPQSKPASTAASPQ
jgi:peptide-methionine (R)-S-oxide reductase